jgi:hypothetical protein
MNATPIEQQEAMVRSVSLEALVARRAAVAQKIEDISAAFQDIKAIYEAAGLEYHAAMHGGYRYVEPSVKAFDKDAWKMLIKTAGVFDCMSSEKRKEWDDALEHGSFPELTLANIQATIAQLLSEREEMLVDSIVKAAASIKFDYKTNTPQLFTPKIVLTYFSEGRSIRYGGRVSVIEDLTRILCILDKAPIPDYVNSAKRISENAVARGEACAENAYFSWVWFKNGNCHLRFKNPSDVERLNKILASTGKKDLRPPSRVEVERENIAPCEAAAA